MISMTQPYVIYVEMVIMVSWKEYRIARNSSFISPNSCIRKYLTICTGQANGIWRPGFRARPLSGAALDQMIYMYATTSTATPGSKKCGVLKQKRTCTLVFEKAEAEQSAESSTFCELESCGHNTTVRICKAIAHTPGHRQDVCD